MMKKAILFFLVILTLVCLKPVESYAQKVDFITTASSVVDNAMSSVEKVTQQVQTVKKEVMNVIKGAPAKLMARLSAAICRKKEAKPNIPGTKEIKKSKIVDVTSEDSIVEGFETLFYTYPEDLLKKYPDDQAHIKEAYKKKAVEFATDALAEAFIVTRQLSEQLEDMKTEYEPLEACYVEGEDGSDSTQCEKASTPEEELGGWNNYYQVNVIYDKLLRMVEELSAVEAQYEAAMYIQGGGIVPIDKIQEETEKVVNAAKEQLPDFNERFQSGEK